MSVQVDGQALFGSGPHVIVAGGLEKAYLETAFPGRTGVSILSLDEDRRVIRQTGTLRTTGTSAAAAAEALETGKAGIDALVQDDVHDLEDDFGVDYEDLVLVAWRTLGPRLISRSGETWQVDQEYEAIWIQVENT